MKSNVELLPRVSVKPRAALLSRGDWFACACAAPGARHKRTGDSHADAETTGRVGHGSVWVVCVLSVMGSPRPLWLGNTGKVAQRFGRFGTCGIRQEFLHLRLE